MIGICLAFGLLLFQDDSLDRLIQDLDADEVATRELAAKKLCDRGAPAVDALRKAAGTADPERAARIRGILAEINARTRGQIAYWGPCSPPTPNPMGTDSLYLIDPDDPKPREVLRGAYQAGELDWIEERRRIFLWADLPRGVRSGLGLFRSYWRLDVGQDPTKLEPPAPSTWDRSPDGKRLAYFADAEGKPETLVVSDAEGKDARPIAPGFRNLGGIAWMPDGQSLLFGGVRVRDGKPQESTGGLYRVKVDGTGLERLGPDSTVGVVTPDGKTMVRLEYQWPAGPKKVFAVDLATTKGRVIGGGADYGRGLALSPEGTRATFVRAKDSVIIVTNVDGSGEKPVAAGDAATWSPDGTRLAYVRDDHLFVYDLASASERKLAPAQSDSSRGLRVVWFR